MWWFLIVLVWSFALWSCEGKLIVNSPPDLAGLETKCYHGFRKMGKQEPFNLTVPVTSKLVGSCEEHNEVFVTDLQGKVAVDFSNVLSFEEYCGDSFTFQRDLATVGIVQFAPYGAIGALCVGCNVEEDRRFPDQIFLWCEASWEASTFQALRTAIEQGNVTLQLAADVNPFESLFTSWPYIATFRFVIPSLFLSLAFLAILFLYERCKWDVTSNGVVPRSILAIESIGCFLMSFIMYYDGWWSNMNGVSMGLRLGYLTMLSGISLCTTFLVVIIWLDVKNKRDRSVRKKRFFRRHVVKLSFAVISILCDFLPVFYPELVQHYQNFVAGYYCVASLTISIFFFLESYKVISKLKDGMEKGATSKSTLRLEFWMRWSAVFMTVFVLQFVLLAVLGTLVWTPIGWVACWSVGLLSRLGISWTQIMLCRIPKRLIRSKKVTTSQGVRSTKILGSSLRNESTSTRKL